MNLIPILLISCILLSVEAGRQPLHIKLHKAPHHAAESVEHETISFGPFDQFLKPLKVILQETTVTTCTLTKLCDHQILNEEPFVKILGPYEPKRGSQGFLGVFEKFSPMGIVKTAFEHVTATFAGEMVTMEEDIMVASFKKMIGPLFKLG